MNYIEAVRVFNPKKMLCFIATGKRDIKNFESVLGLKNPNNTILEEWSSYLILCQTYTDESDDILQWWANHVRQLPILSSLAKQNLTVLLSSVRWSAASAYITTCFVTDDET